MNLTIDIGNTQVKYAIFNENRLIECGNVSTVDEIFDKSPLSKHEVSKIIVSNVALPLGDEFYKSLPQALIVDFDHTTPLPFENSYLTPHTIGKDRLAAIAGAQRFYPNENLLVIDAGTAITYDYLSHQGVYLGGNISLGIKMRFKALNSFTIRLPLVEPSLDFNLLGNNTEQAIRNGVLNGVLSEVEGMIAACEKKYSPLRIVFTGGDTYFFDAKLKSRIFAHANLVLEGLNSILEYNAK